MGTSWMFLYEAYQQIGVSLASLLYYCGPVIIMILSPVIFKERLTASKVAGFLVVLLGIVLVNGKLAEKGNAWGLFCGAMSALMYFFYGHAEQTVETYNGNGKLSDPTDGKLSYSSNICRNQADIYNSCTGKCMGLDHSTWSCEYRYRMLSVFFTLIQAPGTDGSHLWIS